MKIMKLTFFLCILFAFVSFQGNSQTTVKSKNQLLERVNKLLKEVDVVIDHDSVSRANALAYDTLVFKLQKREGELLEMVRQIETEKITFWHFFRPKPHHRLEIVKANLYSLQEVLETQKNIAYLLPNAAVLHISADGFINDSALIYKNRNPENIADSLNSRRRDWKNAFEPWIDEVYQYNIKGNIRRTSFIPIVNEFYRLKRSFSDLATVLPKRYCKVLKETTK